MDLGPVTGCRADAITTNCAGIYGLMRDGGRCSSSVTPTYRMHFDYAVLGKFSNLNGS